MPKKTFEHAIKRLEEVVAELEEGDLPLEEALKIYEEGVELTKYCSAKLNETEDKIKTLVKTAGDFKLKSMDF